MPTQHEAIKLIFPYMTVFAHSSVMFRKDSLKDKYKYNEKMRTLHDYHLFLDLLFTDYPDGYQVKSAILPEILVTYIVHEDSLSHQRKKNDYDFLNLKKTYIFGQVYQSVNQDKAFNYHALDGVTCVILK